MAIEVTVKIFDRIYADLILIIEKNQKCKHPEHKTIDWHINHILKETLMRYRVNEYMEGRKEELKKKAREIAKENGGEAEDLGDGMMVSMGNVEQIQKMLEEVKKIKAQAEEDEKVFEEWEKEYWEEAKAGGIREEGEEC